MEGVIKHLPRLPNSLKCTKSVDVAFGDVV